MTTIQKQAHAVKTILIVDDDADICDFLVQALSEETNAHVLSVNDGFAALKLIRSVIPDLILLDYQLPSMDGLECADMIRASQGTVRTPIVLMSAHLPPRAKAHKELFLLEKPFELHDLLALVEHLLHEPHSAEDHRVANTGSPKAQDLRHLHALPSETTEMSTRGEAP